ncbi:hypothetical protein BSZ39_06395 [Bowdeniella nasicola]|uniref:Uncharacterized protein n=1 Tax=Bowdeniella nasicola TaxID=208480 RepID=A0A1Q5Q2F2_9ACTO|nr:hypothetical protein [Bowdeniella nasicola]OKL54031.1 hypothetical protein BSZ39_06395 [Bowdeniella nasicola]
MSRPSLPVRSIAWALIVGLLVAYLALLVHRGRNGEIPWGIGLAWLLVGAGGIHIRSGHGRIPSLVYALVVIGLPPLAQSLSSDAAALMVGDWRSLTWYIGSITVATLTVLLGGIVRLAKDESLTPPYDEHDRV